MTTSTFEIDDLIRIAKRENNTKRSYLYVNPIQGKHIPVSPSLSIKLFSALAEKIEKRYQGERLLVIGFAETATAIGSTIAYKAENVKFYMNTTRENLVGAEYLFFTESHSHATEQRLVVNHLDAVLTGVDRVVFAEDEVTTGNTIEKLMRILQDKYASRHLKFGIVSILNSMPDKRLQELEEGGFICDFLYRIPVQYRVGEIERHSYESLEIVPCKSKIHLEKIQISGYWNCRVATDINWVRTSVNAFVESAITSINGLKQAERVLILGTEEFMFPGMMIGAEIEKCWPDKTVRYHATTRSPIEVSLDSDYPLHNRMPLESLYGTDRRTFIYNFEKYDKVLIVTDASPINEGGLASLAGALEQYGNKELTVIQWGDFEHAE